MDSAYCTAAQRGQAEFTEKRSRFLGFCSPARTEAEALGFLEEIRAAHRTATHNVWAFSLRENSLCRYSDDGEPQGTAGLPVLDTMMTSGFAAPATPTITCTNYAQRIGTLPTGTKAFYIVASGALNYGGSTVSNSTTGAFMTIADKGIAGPFKVSPLKLTPEVYVVNNATGASPVARIIAVK